MLEDQLIGLQASLRGGPACPLIYRLGAHAELAQVYRMATTRRLNTIQPAYSPYTELELCLARLLVDTLWAGRAWGWEVGPINPSPAEQAAITPAQRIDRLHSAVDATARCSPDCAVGVWRHLEAWEQSLDCDLLAAARIIA